MSLPEPCLGRWRPLALVLLGPDAVVRLTAGIVAVLTRDKERGERCLKVLRILRNVDDPPEPIHGPSGGPNGEG